VVNNNGHRIETKYKIARGKCHLYTVNLQYLRFDLPEPLSRMESWLQTRNTTLNNINTFVQYFIMKEKTQATRKTDH